MHAISRRPTVLVDAGDSPFELPISSLARAILVKARAASASQMTRAKKERDLARHLALEFVAEEHQPLRFATGSGPRMLPSTTHWWTSTTSLNIKNPTTHRLAQELADLTGETLTGAVMEAVRERLERLRSGDEPSLADRLLAIGGDCATRLPEPYRSADHADLLHADDGMPR